MTFVEQMEKDLDVFIDTDEFGSIAIYIPISGPSVPCHVLLTLDVLLQPSDYNSIVVETGTTIEALVRDVGTPPIGSRFIVDSEIYVVQHITDNDGVFITIVVAK